MKKFATVILLVCGLVSANAFAAEWHMPTPYPAATLPSQIAFEFSERVEEETEGEISIRVHPGASLITHTEIPRAVRTGQVQLAEFFLGMMGNTHPVFKHDNIPFLATNYEDAERLWLAAKPEIEKQLDRHGMQLLYVVPWPAQALYTKQPVSKLDDLKGMKMRAYSPSTSRLADLMNTTPSTVEVPDIPQAFSTGIIDAMITSPTIGVNTQAWDYVGHFTDIRAWIPKDVIVINKRVFQRLTDEQQQIILDAAVAAEARGWDEIREIAKQHTRALNDNGIIVYEPSPEMVSELNKIGSIMVEEWENEAPEEVGAILNNYHN